MSTGPDFIIIGAMKCATSTLHEQLALQPGCFMTSPKEPCFFSDDAVFQQGIEWYRSLFADAPDSAICGESSTHYSKLPTYPETVERMRAHFPRLKLVYVMRHPVERLISQYIHEWSQNVIRVPLGRAIEGYPELVEYSLYAKQLRPFLEAFGPENVLPVFMEQQIAHSQATLERVCSFIGFHDQPTWSQALKQQNVSKQRMRNSPLRDALVELPLLRTLRRRLIPQAFRDRVKRLWMMTARPELSTTQLAELESVFDADLAELGRWLGRDLRCERFKALASEAVPTWGDEVPRPGG